MAKQDWTSRLSSRMEGYQENVPDDLWSRIESSLPPVEGRKPETKVLPLRKWFAAAAMVAFIGGGGYTLITMLNRDDKLGTQNMQLAQKSDDNDITANTSLYKTDKNIENNSGRTNNSTSTSSDNAGGDANAANVHPSHKIITSQKSINRLLADNRPYSNTSHNSKGEENDGQAKQLSGSADASATMNKNILSNEQGERDAQVVKEEKSVNKNNESKQVNKPEDYQRRRTNTRGNGVNGDRFAEYARHKHSRPDFTVGLYAMNGMADKNYGNSIIMTKEMQEIYNKHASQTNASIPITTSTAPKLPGFEEATHHRAPLSFGLSVDIPLNERWSISTGCVYTHLYSEIVHRTPAEDLSEDKKYEYVGVPLSLNMTVWKNEKIRTYASAGAQLDFNVKAQGEKNNVKYDIDKDKANVSGILNAGLQYNIIPQAGVYVEPGLRYYFNNGSNVENYFKYKQLNFNLQVGFRYNFK